MSRFLTPEHLVSWATLCPRTIQSGAKNTAGPAGQGNPWLKGALGEATNAAARTDTSTAPATGASSNAAATPKPWSPSPARYSSSPGT
ncbi:transposase [Embleya sp. NPDC008237]|uniref:transposase n=1 Tax=Embleya sp. NPDC008237 TaxID=3363978 RepID=UPI0036F0EC62